MGKEDFPSFDSLISYPIAHKIIPHLHKYGITPNQITYFNLVFRILISLLYYKDVNILIIILLTVVSQIIDCIDGAMARKYNMGSEFGKHLDINTDIIVRIIFYNVIILKNKKMIKYIIPIFILDMISSAFYKNENDTVRYLEMNGVILQIIFLTFIKLIN
jgi:phosphatidylglycerophosphate synthase